MLTELYKSIIMEIKYAFNQKTLNQCFDKTKPSDIKKVQRTQYAEFLEVLSTRFLPIAVQQTAKISRHIGDISERDLFTLWHFLHGNIKYKADPSGIFETIKLPNHVWANRKFGGGDCEDINGIFCSSILVNWGIEHEMIIEQLSDKAAHIFVKTQNGVILDGCNTKFNKQVRLNNAEPLGIYRQRIDLQKSLGLK